MPGGGTKGFGSWKQQPGLPRSCQKPRQLHVPLGSAHRANTDVAVVLECCSKQETDRRV